jgi:hypothetical protein
MKGLKMKDVRFKHTDYFIPYSSFPLTKSRWKKDKTTKTNVKEKKSIHERNKRK